MAPRRPSSATDIDSRMPFASAEALLWGPEMKQQHTHLLKEMRTLQRLHEAYDARIRATEHVAEAAEGATSRVRHLEQQLAAIEAEDNDKAFEKWAAGEMTRLGIFVDTNKHVRQKQIELDNVVSRAVEDLDKLRQVPKELKVVLQRLDLLEAGQKQDTRRIKSLEEQVTRLKSRQHDFTSSTAGSQAVSRPQQSIMRSMTPSQLLNAEISDSTTETDDEDSILRRRFLDAEIQVPQSLEMREEKADLPSAPSVALGPPVKSARHRLMQRPSIHDSMLPQMAEEQRHIRPPAPEPSEPGHDAPVATQPLHHNRQSQAAAPDPAIVPAPTHEPRPRARVAPPPTQLVNRSGPRKRKLPEREPQTQRLTRAQAKKCQEQETEGRKPPGADSHTLLPPTQIVDPNSSSRKKQKTAYFQGSRQINAKSSTATRIAGRAPADTKRNAAVDLSKNTAIEPTQLVTRSPAKSNILKATRSPVKKNNTLPVRPNSASAQKQNSLIVILRSPQKATGIDLNERDNMQITAADRVKMSPRKAAAAPLSRLQAVPKLSGAQNTIIRSKPAIGANTTGTRPSSTRMKPEVSDFDPF